MEWEIEVVIAAAAQVQSSKKEAAPHRAGMTMTTKATNDWFDFGQYYFVVDAFFEIERERVAEPTLSGCYP